MIDETGEPLSGIRDLMDMIDPPPPSDGSKLDSASTSVVLEGVEEVSNGQEGTTDVVDEVEERS
jgi:hypothetical protein